MNYTEDIKKRIRNPKYLNLITTAEAAAKYIREARTVWDGICSEEGEDFAADWDDDWLEKTKQAIGIEK